MTNDNKLTEVYGAQKPAPDIFTFYIPGGGMLGILPAMAIDYLEQVLETPFVDFAQVRDGVSTGGIVVGTLSIRDPQQPDRPKYTARDVVDLYCTHGPKFFPDIPFRFAKMFSANVMNMVEDVIDPLKTDSVYLREIKDTVQDLKREAKGADQLKKINQLEDIATTRWLSKSQQQKAFEICDELTGDKSNPLPKAGYISEFVFLRRTVKSLNSVFSKSAMLGLKIGKQWATGYLHDPQILENCFRETLGEARFSDVIGSINVFAFNKKRKTSDWFGRRQDDYFDTSPNASASIRGGDLKIWDAVMATAANPFAFPQHVSEQNIPYKDMATGHSPTLTITDVIHNKPKGMNVKLVVLGTGSYVTKKVDNEALRTEHERLGTVGNLQGEIRDFTNTVMSESRQALQIALKEENIFEFSPRLSPRGRKESERIPSINILDASEENLDRIINTGLQFISEQRKDLDELAKHLADNLYRAGKIDRDKLNQIIDRIDNHPVDYNYERPPFPAQERKILNQEKAKSPAGRLKSIFNMIKHKLHPAPEQDNKPEIKPTQNKRSGTDGPSL